MGTSVGFGLASSMAQRSLHRLLCAGGRRPCPPVMARDLGPLFTMIYTLGWLLLALLVLEFGTFNLLDVLHAVLLLCGSLTVRLI